MQLKPVATFDTIEPEVFRKEYYEPGVPVVIKNLSHDWPAYTKWNWDYFKQLVGDKKVPLYNNVKSDAYTPINTADDYKTFGEYIDMIKSGPAAWRIFLFNIFDHAPQLIKDFTWPEHLMKGFIKKYPMLFTGGAGSITHMHFDFILEPGDTLFMPAGYWHHMEYLESGFAMSLRAMQPSIAGKLRGAWSLIGMRNIDTLMKKTMPQWWYKRKEKKVFVYAERELNAASIS